MKTILIIFGAKYLIALPILIAIIFLFRALPHVPKQASVMGAIIFVLTYTAATLAGIVYVDPRPFVVGHFTPLIPYAADNGFPSDHTLLAAAIAAVITRYNWRLGIVLWVIALLIGTSRVLAGLHHPIDILGSFVIAGMLAWFTFSTVEKRIYI